jgi:serine/threonine-protein kinase
MRTVAQPCPSDEELQELTLRPDATPPAWFEAHHRLEAHLDGCASCRGRLAEARADATLFAELRAAVQPPAGPPAIPGYRLEGELARGGQGIVYRAQQLATSRPVALKLLGAGSASSARERRRFELEVELGARLAHPGIVTVFDSGVTGGALWYAMELVEGRTLDAFVAETRPTLARKLELFLELCEAVAHAHRHGVLHRDLKPSNVLIDAEGRVRVLDFGTALLLENKAIAARRRTAPGEFLGTLAYAAPEQVAAGAEACDTRADVYALGVVLHELVTGALPIDVRGSLAEVVERIAHAAPPRDARLPRDLQAILDTALAKERERRYPSVEAFARDLRRFLALEPVEARAGGLGYALALALRRRWKVALAAGLVLVAGGGLLVAFVHARLSANREHATASLVRSVFEDILAAAAPQRMGGDARLRDVLALAARDIDTSLEGAPDAQAAVRFTIGDTYRKLLMPHEAVPHLRAALERVRAVDAEGLETARCLDALGTALSALESPEAIPVQEEALALRQTHLDADDPLVAASERGLALALVAQVRDGDVVRARALLDAALARQRRTLGDDHAEVAETKTALARIVRWESREDGEALELLTEAAAVFERPENERDPRRIACLNELASQLEYRKRFDEAEEALARAEKLTQALYGDELATEMLRHQADLRYARGDMPGAEELTRRALVFELRRWAERRPDEAREIERVARELEDAHPPEREPPYVDGFRLLRRFEGDGAFELAGWMNGIVVTLEPQGRHEESARLLDEALNIRCRAWGSDCPIRQRSLLLLAQALVADEHGDQARPRLEESIAIAERRGEPDSASEARRLLASLREDHP